MDGTGAGWIVLLSLFLEKQCKHFLDRAERLIRKALSLDRNAEYYDVLGVVLHKQGNDEEAVAGFKKALALNPSLQSARLNLALVQRSKQDLRAAIADKQRALAACKGDCEPQMLQLSVLYYHAGETRKAAEVLASLIERGIVTTV